MIRIINPGWLSIIVDGGRYGLGAVGVPTSSVLDRFAYCILNHLVDNDGRAPVIEVMGDNFSFTVDTDVTCAITGARVRAFLNDQPLQPWASFSMAKGSILTVQDVTEGFRYYVGFSCSLNLETVIGSYSTNLECRFGGLEGRALQKGDEITFKDSKMAAPAEIPERYIPSMTQPHRLRIVEGPEIGYFARDSIEAFTGGSVFTVSGRLNRTGIRLEGKPLTFRKELDTNIISEGILPGTIQIPGDGLPIIILHERTIGGYARIAMVAKVDQDILAHLKPGDNVHFEKIDLKEAESLWKSKQEKITFLKQIIGRLV